MAGIGSLTPVKYLGEASLGENAVEFVGGYFSVSGKVAVVIRGNDVGESQEVELQDIDRDFCATALKVATYFTVVLPVLMLVINSILRSLYCYHVCPNRQPPIPPPPIPQPPIHWDDAPVAKAPLTLVRAEAPSNLDISVMFDGIYEPIEPTVPAPTKVENHKHTWTVMTARNGTLDIRDKQIKMIWWEAIRHETKTRVDSSDAVCIHRGDLKGFLTKSLLKMGVEEKELGSFVTYWEEVFKNSHDSANAPYILVQSVKAEDQGKYIPTMEIGGADAEKFALNRFYFRFEPVANPTQGLNAEAYLASLIEETLGKNVVIDLGGEIALAPAILDKTSWDGEAQFNRDFIKDHIFA